jgi:hypothetical protein
VTTRKFFVAVQGSGQQNIIGRQGMSGEGIEQLFNLTELHGKGWTAYEESIGDRHAKGIALNEELDRDRGNSTIASQKSCRYNA